MSRVRSAGSPAANSFLQSVEPGLEVAVAELLQRWAVLVRRGQDRDRLQEQAVVVPQQAVQLGLEREERPPVHGEEPELGLRDAQEGERLLTELVAGIGHV